MGLSGVIIISVFLLCGLLGNLISLDKTADSNLINLNVALLRPGTSVTFFTVEDPRKQSLVDIWLNGKHEPLIHMACSGYTFINDTAYITLYNSGDQPVKESIALKSLKAPYKVQQMKFLLGTDGFGRDVLSRIINGSRVSLSVGFVAVFIALFTGTFLGLLAGYLRGKTDLVISWIINVVWSMPTMLLVVAVSFAMGKGFWQIFIAIGLSTWVEVARVVRGQVFGIREKEFIQAAFVLGFSKTRIMLRHILPN